MLLVSINRFDPYAELLGEDIVESKSLLGRLIRWT